MNEPRLCEFMKHRRVGGFGWIAQYEATVMHRFAGEPDYSYLSGWYSGMLNDLLTELGERELEHICQRIRRRESDVEKWYPRQEAGDE